MNKISTRKPGGFAVGILLALSIASAAAWAEARPEVLERIKPVGQVMIEGQAAPEPKAEPAPAAEAAPAAAPVAAAAPAAASAGGAVDGKARYQSTCFACHGTGAAGAPKLGDKAAWEKRIAKGMDALLNSAKNGVPGTAMAPRGTCADCSDEELKAIVEYMVSQSK